MVQAQRPVDRELEAESFAAVLRSSKTAAPQRGEGYLDGAVDSSPEGFSFTCEQADLSHHLTSVGRAVASRPALPVLANVLVEADAETQRVALTAFDLNLCIRSEFEAQVKGSGRTTLPAKLLSDIVSRLPSGPMTLALRATNANGQAQDDAPVLLTSAAGQYQVRSMSAEEYPTLPEILLRTADADGDFVGEESPTAQALELPIESLLQGIGQTLFAASGDETKQVLTGVHVKLLAGDPPCLEFAATDGHRLAMVQVEAEGIPVASAHEEIGLDFTIPARTLREVERILGTQTAASTVELRFDRSQVQFVLPPRASKTQCQQRITSRLLEGQYPDYNRLIPRQFERQITLERRPLIESLERVGVLAAQRNDIVKFNLSAATQTLRISTEAPDVGSGEESLPVQMSGPDLELAFNVRYLLDALRVFHTQQVSLELNGATQPAIWKPLGAMRLCYLVMPVQLRAT
ncbi:DNA polymerase III subunit beta [Synechococcus sp. R60.3]|uniref:DNA polymerase III subunit beta n=1 Tax=Synechococcus sp. R60.3 TaxID=2967123 RepID=UPI0039C3A1F4